MDRFDRIFQLHQLLSSARLPVSRQRIEQELECSRSTAKRIIESMCNHLNAPIEYDRKRNGYYYNRAQSEMFELPGIWFNASELHALLSVQQLLANIQPGLLERQLAPLQGRIEKLLQTQHTGSSEISRRIRILKMAARPTGEHFKTVAGAVAQRQRLQINYYSRSSDTSTERELSPQRLVHYRDNWYLDAQCHLRNSLRTFSLDAINSATSLDKSAINTPDDELDSYYASAYGIFAGKPDKTALLQFNAEQARWVAGERWHPQQQGEWQTDGSYQLQLPYSDPRELIMDILKYGPNVEVLEPLELRQQIASLHQQAADLYKATG